MNEIIKTYQEETEEGLIEVKVLANGVTIKSLIEPSEDYIAKRKGEELLNSLIPSEEDVRKAENEIQIINLLMEVGLV